MRKDLHKNRRSAITLNGEGISLPEKRARATDPATSHAAAARLPEFVGSHCARILACLERYGPQSKDEIAARTGLSGVQVARRLPDLYDADKAMPTAFTSKSMSGREERLWLAWKVD